MKKTNGKVGTKRVLSALATRWLATAGVGFAADPARAAKPAGTQSAVDGPAVLDHATLWRFWRVTGPSRVRTPDGKLALFSLGGGHQWGTEVSEARYSALPGAGQACFGLKEAGPLTLTWRLPGGKEQSKEVVLEKSGILKVAIK